MLEALPIFLWDGRSKGGEAGGGQNEGQHDHPGWGLVADKSEQGSGGDQDVGGAVDGGGPDGADPGGDEDADDAGVDAAQSGSAGGGVCGGSPRRAVPQ